MNFGDTPGSIYLYKHSAGFQQTKPGLCEAKPIL